MMLAQKQDFKHAYRRPLPCSISMASTSRWPSRSQQQSRCSPARYGIRFQLRMLLCTHDIRTCILCVWPLLHQGTLQTSHMA
jgi:hypothetical protein